MVDNYFQIYYNTYTTEWLSTICVGEGEEMKRKFKLGDIIFCPLYDQGDILIISIERNHYKAIGISDMVDGDTYKISECEQELYDVVGNIFEKDK